jgi:hypothetical protein
MRAGAFARIVLGLLVLASVAALFYAQALKREDPLVNGHGGVTRFRPGGPGVTEAHFHLKLSVNDVVDVAVLTATSDRLVKWIARKRKVREYRQFELVWNGTTVAGTTAPPASYVVEVRLEHAGQTVVVPGFLLRLEGPSG